MGPAIGQVTSMTRFVDNHLLVYCCDHVFRHERGVLYVSREDGDWQFLCGQGDHPRATEPVVVGVGHLVTVDPSLDELADLPSDWEAKRKSVNDRWIRTELAPKH